ncbi:hypothetical protein GCM10009801_56730 [Streptomyces albiaxialis]|uniref:Uncharacterized protein n=1 Tax=Streptomyces albiaxialis TaxID=329523 RepID=A0ABN2WFH3_9ACTN
MNTSLQFGSVLGLAVLSGVSATVTAGSGAADPRAALTEGFAAAFLTGAVLAALAALFSVRLRLGARTDEPTKGMR